ncbi:hypothetical protein [Brachybacterium hainanense]|uniref:Uncharacterized protein n=1 Tax=Brachybacterium hainanense TaxID=1541174 RepID=A0ABV6RC42_9MICO
MFTTTSRDEKIAELRRQLEAAEAEKSAQEKRERAELARVQKVAGANHSRLVLALYELLGVEPEHGTTRTVKGEVREVAVDKDETLRTQRLYDLVRGLAERADGDLLDELRLADEEGREERRPRPKPTAPADAADDERDAVEEGTDEHGTSSFDAFSAEHQRTA